MNTKITRGIWGGLGTVIIHYNPSLIHVPIHIYWFHSSFISQFIFPVFMNDSTICLEIHFNDNSLFFYHICNSYYYLLTMCTLTRILSFSTATETESDDASLVSTAAWTTGRQMEHLGKKKKILSLWYRGVARGVFLLTAVTATAQLVKTQP